MQVFDFPAPDGSRERLIFDTPRATLAAHDLADVRPVLREVDAAIDGGRHAVGFVAYEAAPAFEPGLAARSTGGLPLAWFAIHDAPARQPAPSPRAETAGGLAWRPALDQAAYDAAIARIHRAIGDGDVYQVNYTFPLTAAVEPAWEPQRLYDRLVAAAHGSYSAFLDIGTHQILSFSPELFFERRGRTVTCRPMKGTAPRGRWPEEDAARAHRLHESAKDRAENVMIVDLVRNDLGRVAAIGSVRVPALWAVERYPTVWQMTSTVQAETRPGTRLEDLFAALFPCGSVTGAPKISAMQAIAALEPWPRGVYCGAIGMAAPDRAVFNVAIRTLTVDRRSATAAYPVGGGVTWDSTPRGEYAEALAKAALLDAPAPPGLIETMRLEDGALVRAERHLARLRASADHLGTAVDEAAIQAALAAEVRQHPEGRWRVRLLAAADGHVDVTMAAAPAAPEAPVPVALAAEPVDPGDWRLFHKTTARAPYDTRRAARPDVFDVLLWNTRGELTEFTIGNLVLELDGQRYTPPRASGLLGGVFRAALLESGAVQERTLTRADLASATAVWLVNSLREWVRAVVI